MARYSGDSAFGSRAHKIRDVTVETREGMSTMKAEFTVFEDVGGYWYVPKSDEAAAIATPIQFRNALYPTKIAACRAALGEAVTAGATELHLYGFGATTGIQKEAKAKGIKPFVYFASISTRLSGA